MTHPTDDRFESENTDGGGEVIGIAANQDSVGDDQSDSRINEADLENNPAARLGQHLNHIRLDRNLTLRQVEDLSDKVVSNPYLSQIEKGKIKQPSPNILHTLARIYNTSYEKLMEMAGYIVAKPTENAAHGRAATFAELNLSEQEEHELLEYLKWKRSMKGNTGEGG